MTDDYLQKLRKNPRRGLVELIDNALDADATNVTVAFEREPTLGALQSVTVSDNGDGMSSVLARNAFGNLGDSWKASEPRTRSGRARRGRRGSGRWAAFSIGENVTWTSTSHPIIGIDRSVDPNRTETVRVRGVIGSPGEFDIDDVASLPSTGTVVSVTSIATAANGIDGLRKVLTGEYAVELRRAPKLTVLFDGQPLDPEAVISNTVTVPVRVDHPDVPNDLVLTIVEWAKGAKHVRPTLVLTDAEGTGLYDHLEGITRASWPYTAYLSWGGFTEHKNVLAYPVMHPEVVIAVIDAGLDAVSSYVRARQDKARANLVAGWRREGSYPYDHDPEGPLEEVERDLFDVLAVTAAPVLQDITPDGRKLSMRLMREALVSDPTHLGVILNDVLALTPEQVEEFHDLLQRTTLPALIAASGVVTHRLDIINGLQALLYDAEPSAQIKERKHLHEIAAAEPWLFGDEYSTAVSDRSLTQVLRAHQRDLQERVILDEHPNDDPVLFQGRNLRVDLMLSRVWPLAANLHQHLVVELKRPSKTLDESDILQLERYAYSIQNDNRFHERDVRWDFVLVGNTIDEFGKHQAEKLARASTDNFTIRVLTWGNLLHNRRHQLKFVQDALDVTTNAETGVARLKLIHGEHLPNLDERTPEDQG